MIKHLFSNNILGLSPQEALTQSGLNWTVVKKIMRYEKTSGEGDTKDTWEEEVPGHKAIVRQDTQKVLSVVTNSYEPNQNSLAFDLLTPYVNSGKVTLLSAGSLKGGLHIYVVARVNAAVVSALDIEPYIFVTSSFDKTAKLEMSLLPVKSGKTILYPRNKFTRVFQHKHTKNVNPSQELLDKAYYSALEKYKICLEQFGKLSSQKIDSEGQVDLLLKTILATEFDPDSTDEPKMNVKRFERIKQIFFSMKKEYTLFGVFDAVSEFVSEDDTTKTKDTNAHSALFGEKNRLLQNAFNCLMEF